MKIASEPTSSGASHEDFEVQIDLVSLEYIKKMPENGSTPLSAEGNLDFLHLSL